MLVVQMRTGLVESASLHWCLAVGQLVPVSSVGAASLKKSLQHDVCVLVTVPELDHACRLCDWECAIRDTHSSCLAISTQSQHAALVLVIKFDDWSY